MSAVRVMFCGVEAIRISDDKTRSLFRSFKKDNKLITNLPTRTDVLYGSVRGAAREDGPYRDRCTLCGPEVADILS